MQQDITNCHFRNAVFGCHCNSVAALFLPSISDFTSLFNRQFHGALSALNYGVHHVFVNISKLQMQWVHTGRVVSSWAIMQNVRSFWNWTNKENPRSTMGIYKLFVHARSKMAISNGVSWMSKNPTSVGIAKFYLSEKPFGEAFRKSLRSQIIRVSVWLHNQFIWLCRAPGLARGAGAPFNFAV